MILQWVGKLHIHDVGFTGSLNCNSSLTEFEKVGTVAQRRTRFLTNQVISDNFFFSNPPQLVFFRSDKSLQVGTLFSSINKINYFQYSRIDSKALCLLHVVLEVQGRIKDPGPYLKGRQRTGTGPASSTRSYLLLLLFSILNVAFLPLSLLLTASSQLPCYKKNTLLQPLAINNCTLIC